MLGIGIDTGGTCTDAIVYDLERKQVLASGKSATTHEQLEIGIQQSIRKLPRELVDQASYISLSTTLATNACVENKGGRVCLIFIGMERKTVEDTYQQYGFDGMEFMRFLDGNASKHMEPDWAELEAMIPDILEQYDAVAVSQFMPRENNGAYEKEVRRRIQSRKQMPVVCAYEIFKDFNMIKRGAGALLNARLIPVMESFFAAIHHVLEEEEIHLPFFIMRSDGSLVTEQYSMQYPVETLLCGPTASAKGAMELMGTEHAMIIDMGGTTSDVGIVTKGEPVVNEDGVKVGNWETFVRGIEIDTFALGGDTRVAYKDRHLYLEQRRVIPISSLAGRYPQILQELKEIQSKPNGSTRPLYEHLIQMKSLDGIRQHYTEQELAIYDALQQGPLSIRQLADQVESDVFNLKTERLEAEGVIQRSGFTATDAMVLKGDRIDEQICPEAAELAARFIYLSIKMPASKIPDEVYRLVKERLYCNLVRILWEHSKPTQNKKMRQMMEETILEYAKNAFASEQKTGFQQFQQMFATDAVLLGAGAPIHVFLDDVAKALHTTSKVSVFSGVSNALGAVLGDACAIETIHIGPDYEGLGLAQQDNETAEAAGSEACIVYGDEKICCGSWEQAMEVARQVATERAIAKVKACGAKEVYEIQDQTKQNGATLNYGSDIILGIDVTVYAKGKLI